MPRFSDEIIESKIADFKKRKCKSKDEIMIQQNQLPLAITAAVLEDETTFEIIENICLDLELSFEEE